MPFSSRCSKAARSADALVVFNRLWDPELAVAFGGFDLSDRNLRVLEAARAQGVSLPPLTGTGNVSSGRLILEYARPAARASSCTPSSSCHSPSTPPPTAPVPSARSTPCCSSPEDGLIAGMLDLEVEGALERRGGELRFLDLSSRNNLNKPRESHPKLSWFRVDFWFCAAAHTERRNAD